MNKADQALTHTATVRAMVLHLVSNASAPILARDLWSAPQVQSLKCKRQTFDTTIYELHKNGLLQREGKPGRWLYYCAKQRGGTKPTDAVTVVEPSRKKRVGLVKSHAPTGVPTVGISFSRSKNCATFEVHGDLVVSFTMED